MVSCGVCVSLQFVCILEHPIFIDLVRTALRMLDQSPRYQGLISLGKQRSLIGDRHLTGGVQVCFELKTSVLVR